MHSKQAGWGGGSLFAAWRGVGSAGFRGNVTRNGFGIRGGLPLFRVGMTPPGIWYISFSIPGTGISWIKYFNRRGGHDGYLRERGCKLRGLFS